MDNQSITPQPPVPVLSQPFKNWSTCSKALKKLPYPPTELDKQSIIVSVQGSPQRLFIAFEFLWWRQKARAAAKFLWLESTALQLLGNGEPEPNLATLPTPADAGKWVFRELREINTLAEWKKYLATGRHFWLLHVILKCESNKAALVEAVLALAECLEHVQTSSANGKPKKNRISPSDPQWIARLIKSRITPKHDLGKAFVETVFSLNATAELSKLLREDSNLLRSQLQKVTETLKNETEARVNSETREQQLQLDLSTIRQELVNTNKALEEEKQHTIRTGGFGGVAKQEAINQVMAIVRQGISHRLESIRQYADREKTQP